MKVDKIELLKFYDFLGDNNVLKDEHRGKAFRWIENYLKYKLNQPKKQSKNNGFCYVLK